MADKEHKCGEVAGTNPPVATPARSEQSKPWSQIYIIRFLPITFAVSQTIERPRPVMKPTKTDGSGTGGHRYLIALTISIDHSLKVFVCICVYDTVAYRKKKESGEGHGEKKSCEETSCGKT